MAVRVEVFDSEDSEDEAGVIFGRPVDELATSWHFGLIERCGGCGR